MFYHVLSIHPWTPFCLYKILGRFDIFLVELSVCINLAVRLSKRWYTPKSTAQFIIVTYCDWCFKQQNDKKIDSSSHSLATVRFNGSNSVYVSLSRTLPGDSCWFSLKQILGNSACFVIDDDLLQVSWGHGFLDIFKSFFMFEVLATRHCW